MEKKYKVTNRSNSQVIYNIPELGPRKVQGSRIFKATCKMTEMIPEIIIGVPKAMLTICVRQPSVKRAHIWMAQSAHRVPLGHTIQMPAPPAVAHAKPVHLQQIFTQIQQEQH